MRHSGIVRVTHWISALSVGALVVSGFAILLAHPRLYWGETGAVGSPSLLDLPLPFVLTGQSGWGRYLHFLSAWASVVTGAVYVAAGLATQHFRRDLLPARAQRSWAAIWRALRNHVRLQPAADDDSRSYNVLQRLAYASVVFVLFPLMMWTGFAMSPALTSVMPALVTMLGGQQSARTIHFVVGTVLVLFVIVHIVMVWVAGFSTRMRAMILGDSTEAVEQL